jgi:hypothetical protein
MNFIELHERLRQELLRRIDRGVLSGSLLSRMTGIRQAHISNVLRNRRLLSLKALDQIMAAQNLTIEQLAPFEGPADRRVRPRTGDTASIPVVSHAAILHEPQFALTDAEFLHIPATLLQNRARPTPRRSHWQRYAAIRLDAEHAAPMQPLLSPDCLVLIDRHYSSLMEYRGQPALHAVSYGEKLMLRFVTLEDNHLILRPFALDHPVRLIRLAAHDSPSDFLYGRACLLIADL